MPVLSNKPANSRDSMSSRGSRRSRDSRSSRSSRDSRSSRCSRSSRDSRGRALAIVFQVRSLYVSTQDRLPPRSLFRESLVIWVTTTPKKPR